MNLDRFEELYERYVDGSLDVAGRAEFLALLGDAACRARFVELSAYEAALSEELTLAGRETKVDETRPAEEKKPSSKRLPAAGRRASGRISVVHLRRGKGASPAAWPIGVGVAAAFLIAVLILLATASSGKGGTKAAPAPVAEKKPLRPESRPAPAVEIPKETARPVQAPEPPPRIEPTRESRTPEPLVVPLSKPAEPVTPKAPAPAPAPAKPETRPEPAAPRDSATFIAQIERASDPKEVGKGIVSGQGLGTAAAGYLAVRFPDGTLLELGSDTLVARLSEGAAGKSVQVERGLIAVEAAKQPPGKSLVVTTPFADAAVLGTEFTLWTTASFTRLDVKEGRVKFTRPPGVTSTFVGAGQYAIAGQGHELTARPTAALWKAPAAGLLLWLRADHGVRPGEWADASPAGNHATQPAAASVPLLVSRAAGTRPALRFDGQDDFYHLPDGFADFKAGLSAFVVARPAAGAAYMRFLDLDAGPACDNIVFGRKDTADKLGFWVYSNNLTRGKVDAPGAVLADQVQSFGVVLAGAGRVTLYKNGAAVAAGQTSVPVNVVRKPNAIAKSSTSGDPYFKGDLFEILLFNRALADPERAYVDAYLNSKYFDPTAPPPMNRPAEK